MPATSSRCGRLRVALGRPLALAALLVAAGCSSDGETIVVNTNPWAAQCILSRSGSVLSILYHTPAIATVVRGPGELSITCERPGYETVTYRSRSAEDDGTVTISLLRLSRPAPTVPPWRPLAPQPAPVAAEPEPPRASPPPGPKPPPAPRPVTLAAYLGARRSPAAPVFAWPVEGAVVTPFGLAEDGTTSDGIDIAASDGAAVDAAASGVVTYAGNGPERSGSLVLVRHPGGWISAYETRGRLGVKAGDAVAAGQEIARLAAGDGPPRLHFELRFETRPVDPLDHLRPYPAPGPAPSAADSGRTVP